MTSTTTVNHIFSIFWFEIQTHQFHFEIQHLGVFASNLLEFLEPFWCNFLCVLCSSKGLICILQAHIWADQRHYEHHCYQLKRKAFVMQIFGSLLRLKQLRFEFVLWSLENLKVDFIQTILDLCNVVLYFHFWFNLKNLKHSLF